MFRFATVFILFITAVTAEELQHEGSLEMCRSLNHRFDTSLDECIYCAHGLTFDSEKSQCVGTPDVIGKCYGEDHYHAATQECMYCAKGHDFDEGMRICIPKKESQEAR